MTATVIVAIVAGMCLGGFVQGLSGFAFGLVTMNGHSPEVFLVLLSILFNDPAFFQGYVFQQPR